MAAPPGKYLTFHLGREEFGFHVLHIKEILAMQEITAVPQTAPHLRGVINLRGRIVPVVDLRVKFGLERPVCWGTACIVVVQVQRPDELLLIGVIVDSVCEVVNLTALDIEEVADSADRRGTPYLLGLAKIKGTVKILLGVDEVLNAQELQGLDRLGAIVN